jgi:hypothetical protein
LETALVSPVRADSKTIILKKNKKKKNESLVFGNSLHKIFAHQKVFYLQLNTK